MTDIDALYGKLKRDAERRGYRLNPDEAFVKALIEGLLANGARYGYESCPCRLAAGKRTSIWTLSVLVTTGIRTSINTVPAIAACTSRKRSSKESSHWAQYPRAGALRRCAPRLTAPRSRASTLTPYGDARCAAISVQGTLLRTSALSATWARSASSALADAGHTNLNILKTIYF